MEREKLDRNINIISWLFGATIFTILTLLKIFEAEMQQHPNYGLMILFILLGVAQFINYQLVGKYRASLNIPTPYVFNKLLLHPGIWIGVLMAGLVYALSS